MEDIRRICNLIVDLSKFTSNKKVLSKVLESKTTINFVTQLCLKNKEHVLLFCIIISHFSLIWVYVEEERLSPLYLSFCAFF